jgi:hypothetical protein
VQYACLSMLNCSSFFKVLLGFAILLDRVAYGSSLGEEGFAFPSIGVSDEGFYTRIVALVRIFRVFLVRVRFHKSLVLLKERVG